MGDAIRNGAMRFGVGTYLWSKSEEAERRKLGEAEAQDAPAQAPDWPKQFEDAKARGPETFGNWLKWAKSHGGPPEMIAAGEKLLDKKPVEGEVLTNEG